jgi:hypothetical protein
MRRVLLINAVAYRFLIFLYPPAFRRDFGIEMTLDFEDTLRDACNARGWSGLASVWLVTFVDLGRTVPLQWIRSPLFAAGVVSAVSTSLMMYATASLAPRGRPVVTFDSDSPEQLIVFFILIVTLLAVIGATITFSLWFLGPLRRRR